MNFPLLFPHGFVKPTLQANQHINWPELLEMLYLHTSGAWGDITESQRKHNLAVIENRQGTVKSRQVVNDKTFVICTKLGVDDQDRDRFLASTGNYGHLVDDRHLRFGEPERCEFSGFCEGSVITEIHLATLHELVGKGA